MTILPSPNFVNKFTSLSRDREFIDISSVFYNDNIDVLITKNYLNHLETIVDDLDILQSLIMELSDNQRLVLEHNDTDNLDIFENIYELNKNSIESLFAISLNENYNIYSYDYINIDQNNKNKEFILFTLLKSNIISFHYYDFPDNKNIINYIKNIFNLQQNVGRITIFNRYSEYQNFEFLKNKSIHYYNFIPSMSIHRRKIEFINNYNDLKNNLGRNLVLKSTSDNTKIHERKIFFNHFFITIDQAFNNLKVTEPNWKIDLEIDRKKCYSEWSKKIRYFADLN